MSSMLIANNKSRAGRTCLERLAGPGAEPRAISFPAPAASRHKIHKAQQKIVNVYAVCGGVAAVAALFNRGAREVVEKQSKVVQNAFKVVQNIAEVVQSVSEVVQKPPQVVREIFTTISSLQLLSHQFRL